MIELKLTSCDNPEIQIEECLDFINKIDEVCKNKNELTIDIKNLKWVLPCAALLISHKINELVNRGYKILFIEPSDENVKTYLSAVGFPLGEKKSRATYMPIHHFVKKADNHTAKVIETEMKEIFNIIRKYFPSELHDGIFYLLAELSDNVDQHSEFTVGSMMAQFYKNKGFIDLGVIDNGITIPGRYEKSKVEFENDCDALKKALRGISTKEGEIGRGKGLETSKRLIQKGLEGDFYILSRNAMMTIGKDKDDSVKIIKNPLNGTFLYIRFKLPKKTLNIYEYIG